MRIALALLLLGLVAAAAPSARAAADDCFGDAQDQHSLNVCAQQSADAADARLNAVYRELIKAQGKDQASITAIRNAQRAWVSFRDLEADSHFPAEQKMLAYGSMYPQCHAAMLESLTRVRTAELCLRLDQAPVCNGVDMTPKLPEIGC